MKDEELITALKRMSVETGGIICFGCGYEHGCSVHGCAILKAAAERIAAADREQAAVAEKKSRRYEVFVVTRDKQGRRSIERKRWTMQPEEQKI